MVTGRKFEVPRLLQSAMDRTPTTLAPGWVYQSLLSTYQTMEGFYSRRELNGRWDRRMDEQFVVAWETHFYELYIESYESEYDDRLLDLYWEEFQAFALSFRDTGAERHSFERLWRAFDRLLAPYNITDPYCLDDPSPTLDWFYVADSEET